MTILEEARFSASRSSFASAFAAFLAASFSERSWTFTERLLRFWARASKCGTVRIDLALHSPLNFVWSILFAFRVEFLMQIRVMGFEPIYAFLRGASELAVHL